MSLAAADQPDFPLVAFNRAFLDLAGYPAEAMLGKNCRFLQPKGGAGPVRDRIRTFLADAAQEDGRFVLANQSFDGSPFLNVLYLAKISNESGLRYVLGSQFPASGTGTLAEQYEAVLRKDIVSIGDLFAGSDWVLQGSIEAIANTVALVARHRVRQDD